MEHVPTLTQSLAMYFKGTGNGEKGVLEDVPSKREPPTLSTNEFDHTLKSRPLTDRLVLNLTRVVIPMPRDEVIHRNTVKQKERGPIR